MNCLEENKNGNVRN